MKKLNLLIISVLFIILSSCSDPKNTPIKEADRNIKAQIHVIKIDGCEYIYVKWTGHSQGPIFTHKGNCSNPIHIYNHGMFGK